MLFYVDLVDLVLVSTNPSMGLGSLAPLWDGLRTAPVTLLLAAMTGGAALTLQIPPRKVYSFGCLGYRVTPLYLCALLRIEWRW